MPVAPQAAPRVFLHYDQQALDDAYDQAVYAPNRDQILARFAYGSSEIEKLDVFSCGRKDAPVNVFIHGGAWRQGLAKNYAFAAELFVRSGAHFVVLDFTNVLESGGDLFPMVDQVRRAVAWVHANCAQFGGDAKRLYVSGTSSGAHLGGCVATTAGDTVRGYVLASGMYDLRGPRLSKRSAYVKFTDAMEDALSPQRHLARVAAPITLVYGSLETPEFQRQSRDFAAALEKAGKKVELVLAQGYNHFELSETLGSPYGPVGRAVLAQMAL